MTDASTLGCRLVGCGGPRSSVCINRLPFDECPDVIELDEVEDALEEPLGRISETVALRGGRVLDSTECDSLLRQRGGIVVGLVAGPNAGKTTLVATMYEMLHRRRMKAFRFAGSETLQGYEERCHLARLSSNKSAPNTQRTPVGVGLKFTHIRIASQSGIRDIVFSDRSGENFESALARPSEIEEFAELHRANVIILLVDLVRLVGDTQLTASKLRRLFMAMDQRGQLKSSKILLVGTKADVAMPTQRSIKAKRELSAITEELSRRAGGRFRVGQHVIACRARSGSAEIGEGVEALLAELLTDTPRDVVQEVDAWPSEPREIDQLMRGYRSARS